MELQIQSPSLNTPLSFDAGVFAAAAAAAAVSMDKEDTRNKLSGYLRSSPVGKLSKALYSGTTYATSFVLTALGSLYKERVSVPKPIPSFSAPIPTTEKKTLVLDLDETLIHSMMQENGRPHFQIDVPFDEQSCIYYVYQRPSVFEFLYMVSQWYTLVIFTASVAEYADPIIDWLEGQVMAKYGLNSELFAKRLYRESCTYRNGVFMKDLAIVDSDLSSVLLVDNSPFSYAINQNNAVPIKTWMNDDLYDECLTDLIPFLAALSGVEDVRSILSLRSPSPQSTCKSAS